MTDLFEQHFEETFGHKPRAGNLEYVLENGVAVR